MRDYDYKRIWVTAEEKRALARMLYKVCFVGLASSLVCVGTCLNSKVLEHNKMVEEWLESDPHDWFFGGADG